MLITYTNYLCVVCVCVCPKEGNVAFSATPNPFHLNKICLNQEHSESTDLLLAKTAYYPNIALIPNLGNQYGDPNHPKH